MITHSHIRGGIGLALASLLALSCAACGSTDNATADALDRIDASSALSSTAAGTTSLSDTRSTTTTTTGPEITHRTVRVRRAIAFRTRTVEDASRDEGTRAVVTRGADGVQELVYRVRVVDGVTTTRTLIRKVTVKKPVTRVVAVGTRSASSCDPNRRGCVPIASDVDCAGGSGNGPAYLDTAVRITGVDIYDLDRDGDGWGCEDE